MLAEGFVWTVTGMGLDFLVPYIFGQTVSLLASRAPSAVLLGIEMGPWTMVATGATAYVVRLIVTDTRNITYVPIAPRAFQKAICDYTAKAVNCSIENRSKPGEDIIRLQKGIIAVSSISALACTQLVPVIGSTLTSAGILSWTYGPQFGGCLVAAVGASAVYNARAAKTIIDLRSASLEVGNKSFDELMTAINHFQPIQSFLKEEFELARVKKSQQAYAAIETKSAGFSYQIARKQDIFQGLVFALMNLLAGRGVLNGQLSAGDFATIQALSMQFFSGFAAFGQSVSQVVSSARDSEVFFDYIHTPPQIIDRFPDAKLNIEPGKGNVEFKKVCFTYKNRPDTQVLTDVLCQIPSGGKIGFAGATGSGKTTILRLLYRFIDPTSGEILIDGKSISEVSLKSLRSSIGIIEQDPVLMSGTLLENILYGVITLDGTPERIAIDNILEAVRLDRQDIDAKEAAAKTQKDSKSEVKAVSACPRRVYQFPENSLERNLINAVLNAAHSARLIDFIDKEKDGLLTMIEERGTNLSGGQKQRVAIARVLMRGENLKILLLDEATSSLDAKTEAIVQQNIDEIGTNLGLTQIWITHHLTNLINAHAIYVLENGKIVQQGTHDELISQDGNYARLWADQTRDKSEEKVSPRSGQASFNQASRRHSVLFKDKSKSQPEEHVITISDQSSDSVSIDMSEDSVVLWHCNSHARKS